MAGFARRQGLLWLFLVLTDTEALSIPSQVHSIELQAESPKPVSYLQEARVGSSVWWLHVSDRLRSRQKPHSATFSDEVSAFFHSVVVEEWIIFLMIWILLLHLSFFIESLHCSTWFHHCLTLCLWLSTAAIFMGMLYVYIEPEAGFMWLDGYATELMLSMENIFLYEIILVSFKVPAKMARKALFTVSIFQMFFQMFFFMGIAAWIENLEYLPYFLGAWLIFVAFQSFKDDEHGGFDPSSSDAYNAFHLAMGDRLVPSYTDSIFTWGSDGRLRMTMLGPVIFCLLLVMFMMEVDVTLTKIEEIPNHFIAWTSSVFAAFALPELFEVVREMLRCFYLLKTGIGLLMLFFGFLLLGRSSFDISGSAQLVVMISIVGGACLLSVLLQLGSRDAIMYAKEKTAEKEGTPCGKAGSILETSSE